MLGIDLASDAAAAKQKLADLPDAPMLYSKHIDELTEGFSRGMK